MLNPTPSQKINFHSPIPYYLQLIDILTNQIRDGVWKPGEMIPGEQELCERYGISRTVVRQALGELELNSLIVRRKGRGTFVAEPKIAEGLVQKLTGFYQDMVERGLPSQTRVLRHEVLPATEIVAQPLGIAAGVEVIVLRRLRYIADEPIQVVDSFLPYALCPQLATVDLTNRSLYEYLERECGLFIARARRTIEATAADPENAALLQIAAGAPLLLLESVGLLEDGRAIEYYRSFHRGDRSRFEVELARSRIK